MVVSNSPALSTLVDDIAIAKILRVSASFLRKDRRTAQSIPFVRIGDKCMYSPERVQASLLAREVGGAPLKSKKSKRQAGSVPA